MCTTPSSPLPTSFLLPIVHILNTLAALGFVGRHFQHKAPSTVRVTRCPLDIRRLACRSLLLFIYPSFILLHCLSPPSPVAYRHSGLLDPPTSRISCLICLPSRASTRNLHIQLADWV
ncbi:hypothetical protein BDQ12DRAFT_688450 [Crucibulum laeve]|uniref:Uncharacterized protein n=1 Tax=Crucibulum laeve TaxID=68775 RepID=A0A5C3LT28_9AGAR|nr:hypothetical protein BDQ12DRAFT_688450 [Crucibulum laeve]